MPVATSLRPRVVLAPLALVASVAVLTLGIGAASASAVTTTYTNSTSVPIPDAFGGNCDASNTDGAATSTITVPHAGGITDVRVAVEISHTWRSDVIVDVTSPAGTTIRLVDRVQRSTGCGSSADDLSLQLDDAASTSVESYVNPGTYRPMDALSAFDGEDAAGVWTLTVRDVSTDDSGTLTSWSLVIDTGSTFAASAPASPVSEDAGAAVFTVTRAGALGATETVDYATVDGTAVAGADYVATSGTLIFAPGVATQQVSVTLLDDAAEELDETFGITLSNATGTPTPELSVASAAATIVDDDGVTPSFDVEASSATIAEDGGSVVFTVTRSGSTLRTDTVDYATLGGTATVGTDVAAASGTLTFAPGETTKTVTVVALDDVAFEDDETFELRLSNAQGAPTPTISTDRAVVAIVDDDDPAVFSVSGPAAPVAEGAGSIEFTVTRTVSTTRTDTVDYATFVGTAATGSDFVPTTGTLTFAPGEATKTVVVALTDDGIHENPETFELRLSNPTGVVTPTIALASATVTIADDDPAPVVASALSDTGADAGGAAALAALLLGAGLVLTLVRRRAVRA